MSKATARSTATTPAKRYADRRRTILRHARAVAKAAGKTIDTLVLTDRYDVRYACGLEEGAAALVIAGKNSFVVTSPMFADVAARQAPGVKLEIFQRGQSADALLARGLDTDSTAKVRKAMRVGITADKLSLARHRSLANHLGARRLVELHGVTEQARAVKDADEIKTTRRCIRIAEAAFKGLCAEGARGFIGRTEKDIASDLEYRMRQLGADRQGFGANGIIVGSGPNSASCHHMPSSRKARKGEIILFDWGAEVDGYRSDITRVVYLQSVPKKMEAIHPIVESALKAGIAALKHNCVPAKVDKAARDLIDAAGYGDRFIHGLGHSLGLEIHEPPFIGRSPGKVKAGTIVTVEPGIYLDGIGGIRLEDDVLVTQDKAKRLTSLPTSLKSCVLE